MHISCFWAVMSTSWISLRFIIVVLVIPRCSFTSALDCPDNIGDTGNPRVCKASVRYCRRNARPSCCAPGQDLLAENLAVLWQDNVCYPLVFPDYSKLNTICDINFTTKCSEIAEVNVCSDTRTSMDEGLLVVDASASVQDCHCTLTVDSNANAFTFRHMQSVDEDRAMRLDTKAYEAVIEVENNKVEIKLDSGNEEHSPVPNRGDVVLLYFKAVGRGSVKLNCEISERHPPSSTPSEVLPTRTPGIISLRPDKRPSPSQEPGILTSTTKQTTDDGNAASQSSGSLSNGEVAGIAVACVLLGCLLSVLIIVVLRRRRQQKEPVDTAVSGPVNGAVNIYSEPNLDLAKSDPHYIAVVPIDEDYNYPEFHSNDIYQVIADNHKPTVGNLDYKDTTNNALTPPSPPPREIRKPKVGKTNVYLDYDDTEKNMPFPSTPPPKEVREKQAGTSKTNVYADYDDTEKNIPSPSAFPPKGVGETHTGTSKTNVYTDYDDAENEMLTPSAPPSSEMGESKPAPGNMNVDKDYNTEEETKDHDRRKGGSDI